MEKRIAARPGGKSAFAAILPLFLRSRVSQYVSMKRKRGVPDGTAAKRTAMRLSSKRGLKRRGGNSNGFSNTPYIAACGKADCSPAGRQIRFCGYPPAFPPFARFAIRIDETKARRAGRHGRQTDSNAAFFEEGSRGRNLLSPERRFLPRKKTPVLRFPFSVSRFEPASFSGRRVPPCTGRPFPAA